MTESISLTDILKQRLNAARTVRGLSQVALARRANLPATAVSQFETGARKPSLDNFWRLVEALGVSADYLLGHTDQMDTPAAAASQLLRRYSSLSAEYQELADEYIDMLAARARRQRGEAAE